ncbi:MAG: HAD-IIIA family hydrolase, partial [Chloroflexi bacterium]|nr:HAD-IIIA family hydrolase [Chloroflexota bacterium]
SRKAVFLDLNGTLVLPVKVETPKEYQAIVGSVEAIRLLNQAGFLCPVITVQSGISKGRYSETAFRTWFAEMQAVWSGFAAELGDVYLCPHSGNAGCECHKPKPKLYLDAARDYEIDCAQSYVVGDTYSDIQAGKAIGAKTCFVETGWADRHVPEHGSEADFVGADILAVAKWIIGNDAT